VAGARVPAIGDQRDAALRAQFWAEAALGRSGIVDRCSHDWHLTCPVEETRGAPHDRRCRQGRAEGGRATRGL
jgi:hypothetical protein